jgi:hypothetical protein
VNSWTDLIDKIRSFIAINHLGWKKKGNSQYRGKIFTGISLLITGIPNNSV